MTGKDTFWWYITLEAPKGQEDLLASLAEASDCLGSEEVIAGSQTCLQAYYRSDQDLGHWLAVLSGMIEKLEDVRIRDMGKVENRPWHTEWMEAFPPLNVGRRLVVMAPWHADGYHAAGRVPLYIHPGSAFGTGYHESTQAALTLLEKAVKEGDRVADIGCGSGILSIAALKLGAASARARDLDPSVLSEAVRNGMELNNISKDRMTIEQGDLLKGFDEQVDLILANILFEPLTALLPQVRSCLKPGGRAIFSGMVQKEAARFEVLLPQAGLMLIERVQLGDWVGLLAGVNS